MVKIFQLLVFCTIALGTAKAQTDKYVISGEVGSPFDTGYAFLSIHGRATTLNTKITNARFNFALKKEPKFEMAVLYFSPDSTFKFTDLQAKRQPWVVEQVDLVLEDSVYITIGNDLKLAKVMGGNSQFACFNYFFKGINGIQQKCNVGWVY